MMKRRIIMEDLGNMNPGELEPRSWDGGETDFGNDTVTGTLPEKACMKARLAAFQAIMEEVVEDAVEEAPADATDAEVADQVNDTADDITDKAVALHLVPSSARGMVRRIVAQKLRRSNRLASLYARAAHLCSEAVSDSEYNAGSPQIDQPLEGEAFDSESFVGPAREETDDSPLDGTSPTTAWWTMEGDTDYNAGSDQIDQPLEGEAFDSESFVGPAREETDDSPLDGTSPTTAWWTMESDTGSNSGGWTVEDEDFGPGDTGDTAEEKSDAVSPSDVAVDQGVDEDTAAEMKYLIVSACHHRRATAKVSRNFSGKIVNQLLHELRYRLPSSFREKYKIY